jgi:hypothetical protein
MGWPGNPPKMIADILKSFAGDLKNDFDKPAGQMHRPLGLSLA